MSISPKLNRARPVQPPVIRHSDRFKGAEVTAARLIPAFVILLAASCAGCATAPTSPPAGTAPPPIEAGDATIVVGQQKCCPKMTLPEFLGLCAVFEGIGKGIDCVRSKLGSVFPGLEAKPELLPITDPANMDSPNPAVAAAADIKAQEDAAAQKIKALRYLATIGCGGCYPDVEAAFLESLKDCTEEVRYEAVKALRHAGGDPCQYCRHSSCCSPQVRKKLEEIGYGLDERNECFQEPSPRVRRIARLALHNCGGVSPPSEIEQLPQEGPSGISPAEGPESPENAAVFWPPRDVSPPDRLSPTSMSQATYHGQHPMLGTHGEVAPGVYLRDERVPPAYGVQSVHYGNDPYVQGTILPDLFPQAPVRDPSALLPPFTSGAPPRYRN